MQACVLTAKVTTIAKKEHHHAVRAFEFTNADNVKISCQLRAGRPFLRQDTANQTTSKKCTIKFCAKFPDGFPL